MDVFFDGSFRGGILRTCVCTPGKRPVVEFWKGADRVTSGHSEWLAALEAAKFAASQSVRRINLVGDCENIIRHMDPQRDDAAPCKVVENAKLADDARAIVDGLRARGTLVVWRHVVRDENPAGVHLDKIWGRQDPLI
jgi:ribonuclease HI